MTVSTTNSVISLTHTGPGAYAFTFRVFEIGDLEVRHIDTASVLLTITTDYTVVLNGDGTGTVTLIYDIPSGGPYTGTIELRRSLAKLQSVDWENATAFDMDILEREFDRHMMLIQELNDLITEGLTPEAQVPINIPTNRFRGRFTTGTGLVESIAVGDLTEEVAPAALDFLIGYLATGEIRKFDITNFLAPTAQTQLPTLLDVEIVAGTALTVGKRYLNKSGVNTHTLPLLSGLLEGDRIALHCLSVNEIVILNEHASDSNDEIWTGITKGDRVDLKVVDGAWAILSEFGPSYKAYVRQEADEAFGAGAVGQIFDVAPIVTTDVGSGWNSGTGRFELPDIKPSDKLLVGVQVSASVTNAAVGVKVNLNGTPIQNPVGSFESVGNPNGGYWMVPALANEYIMIQAENGAGGSQSIRGDATELETFVRFEIIRRIRA